MDDAYRATTYRVFVPDEKPVDLRIGQRSSAIDLLLDTHGCDEWVFITACNPRSERVSASENEARQTELVRVIRERGWNFFEGMGIPADSKWQPEASVLVLGISRDEALEIGKHFGQNAIVVGQRGGAAELVYCA